MIATKKFNKYRYAVFSKDMTKEDYRALQAGKDVKVSSSILKKYPQLFKKEVKHGSTR